MEGSTGNSKNVPKMSSWAEWNPEMIKVGVVTIGIGTKFENFMQAGCMDQGLHCRRTVYF